MVFSINVHCSVLMGSYIVLLFTSMVSYLIAMARYMQMIAGED